MLDVIIALVPCGMASAVYQFGFKVLALLAISVASAVFFEWGYRKLMKKPGSIRRSFRMRHRHAAGALPAR